MSLVIFRSHLLCHSLGGVQQIWGNTADYGAQDVAEALKAYPRLQKESWA